jgi:hypothetical protein
MKKMIFIFSLAGSIILSLNPSVTLSQTARMNQRHSSTVCEGRTPIRTISGTHPLSNIPKPSPAETPRQPERVPFKPTAWAGIQTVFFVTNTNDSGDGSLRKAINDANNSPGLDQIAFEISGSGKHTIMPQSALPAITDPVILDASTQAGYVGVPIIELNGSQAGAGVDGLDITAGNSVVRGFIINRFVGISDSEGVAEGIGIILEGGGNNLIVGNFIGTDTAGANPARNDGSGIAIYGSSSHNVIGGTGPTDGNVISGNGISGIQVSVGSAGGNLIIGNYIGVDASGNNGIANGGNGIYIDAPSDTIGEAVSGGRNIISANTLPGIGIDADGTGTVIVNNYMGTDWSGGVQITGPSNGIMLNGVSGTIIGGTTMTAKNFIVGNFYPGIYIMGPTATNNQIMGNVIGEGPHLGYFGNMDGIYIDNAPSNTIGGSVDSAGNSISYNSEHGIVIAGINARLNVIQGNYIGTSILPFDNDGANYGNGIVIVNAPQNLIGGTNTKSCNYIAGNFGCGIVIEGDTATGNLIEGNDIGYSPTMAPAYYGNLQDGVRIMAPHDTIGGPDITYGNLISYNHGAGIYDSTDAGVTIQHNSITLNIGLGIDWAPRGHTPKDKRIIPILDSVGINYPTSVKFLGRMIGLPNYRYTLEFYESDTDNASHFGEGQTYIGSGSVVCDANGNGIINVTLPASVKITQFLTATATDTLGNTTEFSRALCMLDRDGDGILDIWETPGNGIDWNSDGVIDLDLAAKGARPDHKDIFVEVHNMNGFYPNPGALSSVQHAFAGIDNRFVNNPDGNPGINLHIDIDPLSANDGLDDVPWNNPPWSQFATAKAMRLGLIAERNDPNAANIIAAKQLICRYCIFADQYDAGGSSGVAHVTPGQPGADFIVTLGKFDPVGGTEEQQAGTFMHELGHTLGLRHGGSDGINYKPNFYSVINYLFQFPRQVHSPGTWKLGYSPVALATLDETHLNEQLGFGVQPGDYDVVRIPYARPDGSVATTLLQPHTSIDFDGNGDSSGFSTLSWALNNVVKSDPQAPSATLAGYADWPNLKYNFRGVAIPNAALHKAMQDTTPTEMNPSIYNDLQKLPPYGIVTPLSQWSKDPTVYTPIATGYYNNFVPYVVTDGHGGAIVTWTHINDGFNNTAIYAQRVDSLGGIQWMNNGVPVLSSVYTLGNGTVFQNGVPNPQSPSISDDEAGGAIIAWCDSRAGNFFYDIYVQRLNQDSQTLWTTDGVRITTSSSGALLYPLVYRDGYGGAVIIWGIGNQVFAQRVDALGNARWQSGGVQITGNCAFNQYYCAASGFGGLIIAWADNRNGISLYGSYPIYSQRIDSSGALRWQTGGVPITTTPSGVGSLTDDGRGGDIISWTDMRTGFSTGQGKMYAQRIDSLGQVQWPSNGVPVDTSVGYKDERQTISDNAGGAVIVWWDNRLKTIGYNAIYAQRINAEGQTLWPAGGVQLSDSNSSGIVAFVPDGASGATVFYQTEMRSTHDDIFAQTVDSEGIVHWPHNGIPVASGSTIAQFPAAVSNNTGGAIVVWEDAGWTSNNPRIYAQMVNSRGGLGNGTVTGVATAKQTLPLMFKLLQNYPNPFNPVTTVGYDIAVSSHVVLKVYNILGQLVATLVNDVEQPGFKEARWNAARYASGVYLYRLEATSVANPSKTFTSVKKMILMK